MPAGLKTIHGFQRDRQTGSFPLLVEEVNETLLVECHSALDDIFDLQDSLPGFGGASANMPDGSTITFSLYISKHPNRDRLTLLDASNVRRAPDKGAYWLIDLKYGFVPNPDQSVTNPNNPQQSQQIVYPWQKPPVWSSSSKIVDHFTFRKPDGTLIRHANKLVITEPIRVPMAHEVYSFSFARPYGSFNPEAIRQYMGGLNKTILWGGQPGTWKLTGKNENEQWQQFRGEGQFESNVRFITTSLTFEWNPEGWKEEKVSMSTKQLVTVDGVERLTKIIIDWDGNIARSPWPLLTDGSASPFEPASIDPTQFALINHGWDFQNQIQPDIRTLAIQLGLYAGGVAP